MLVKNQNEFARIPNAVQISDNDFYKLSKFIYTHFGINLPFSKKTLLESRLQKRLRVLELTSFGDYIHKVIEESEHDEIVQMIDLVSTNKTDFFREKVHFDYLTHNILPDLLARGHKQPVSVWSAGCSSGEEAYSLAMTFEEFNRNKIPIKLSYSILGTDISTNVLKKGIEAIYPEDRTMDIPYELKKKYFLRSKDKSASRVRVIKPLRDRVRFRRFNFMNEVYPSHESFDIIFCRNVLIYFDRTTQERIINKLCSTLMPKGMLFLGHSESIMGMDVPLKQVVHAGYKKI